MGLRVAGHHGGKSLFTQALYQFDLAAGFGRLLAQQRRGGIERGAQRGQYADGSSLPYRCLGHGFVDAQYWNVEEPLRQSDARPDGRAGDQHGIRAGGLGRGDLVHQTAYGELAQKARADGVLDQAFIHNVEILRLGQVLTAELGKGRRQGRTGVNESQGRR